MFDLILMTVVAGCCVFVCWLAGALIYGGPGGEQRRMALAVIRWLFIAPFKLLAMIVKSFAALSDSAPPGPSRPDPIDQFEKEANEVLAALKPKTIPKSDEPSLNELVRQHHKRRIEELKLARQHLETTGNPSELGRQLRDIDEQILSLMEGSQIVVSEEEEAKIIAERHPVPLAGRLLYDEAILRRPSNPRLHLELGKYLNHQQQYTEAIEELTKTLNLYPRYPYAFALRGNAYRNKLHYEAALPDFERALKLEPKYTWVLYELARLHNDHHKHREAIRYSEAAIATCSPSTFSEDGHYEIAWAHQQLGELDKASHFYSLILETSPNWVPPVPVRLRRAQVLAQLGKREMALFDLRSLQHESPQSATLDYWNLLIELEPDKPGHYLARSLKQTDDQKRCDDGWLAIRHFNKQSEVSFEERRELLGLFMEIRIANMNYKLSDDDFELLTTHALELSADFNSPDTFAHHLMNCIRLAKQHGKQPRALEWGKRYRSIYQAYVDELEPTVANAIRVMWCIPDGAEASQYGAKTFKLLASSSESVSIYNENWDEVDYFPPQELFQAIERHYEQGHPDQARKNMQKAVEAFGKLHDAAYQRQVYSAAAATYVWWDDFDQARLHAMRAMTLAPERAPTLECGLLWAMAEAVASDSGRAAVAEYLENDDDYERIAKYGRVLFDYFCFKTPADETCGGREGCGMMLVSSPSPLCRHFTAPTSTSARPAIKPLSRFPVTRPTWRETTPHSTPRSRALTIVPLGFNGGSPPTKIYAAASPSGTVKTSFRGLLSSAQKPLLHLTNAWPTAAGSCSIAWTQKRLRNKLSAPSFPRSTLRSRALTIVPLGFAGGSQVSKRFAAY